MPYTLQAYGKMVGDALRVEAYARALRQAIRPGDTVLDLGAGTGFFSLLACQLGARAVHACETNPAIQVARELARANGFADRMTCHELDATRLILPEPVDVIVSDLRGVLPLHGRHLPVLVDARARHLKQGGALIPQRDRLYVALAAAEQQHQRAVHPWGSHDFGLELGPWSTQLANSWTGVRARPEQQASEPVLWAELDYRTIEHADVRGPVRCVASRATALHGFFLWFEATLAAGVSFSGGPGAAEDAVYGCGFFPWPRAVPVREGDEVQLAIEARLVGGDYVWSWQTQVGDARFAQSSFFGGAVSPAALRRRAGDHVPALSEEGLLALRALEAMAAGQPLSRIAEALRAEFPGRFASPAACLTFVGDLSAKYGG